MVSSQFFEKNMTIGEKHENRVDHHIQLLVRIVRSQEMNSVQGRREEIPGLSAKHKKPGCGCPFCNLFSGTASTKTDQIVCKDITRQLHVQRKEENRKGNPQEAMYLRINHGQRAWHHCGGFSGKLGEGSRNKKTLRG